MTIPLLIRTRGIQRDRDAVDNGVRGNVESEVGQNQVVAAVLTIRNNHIRVTCDVTSRRCSRTGPRQIIRTGNRGRCSCIL